VNILLAAAQFSSSISGLQRHALNLAHALIRQPEISTVHLVVAPWQRHLVQQADFESAGRLIIHIAEMRPGPLGRNFWYFQRLPQLAAAIMPDIVHLSYPVPVRASALHCPLVLTLHDLYPYEIPGNFGFPKVFFNRGILQHCLRNADAIACVSDSTLLRLRQYGFRSAWSRAERIYNCVESTVQPEPEPSLRGWSGHPFLLTVSQHRRNKNIPLLIRAFHRLLVERRITPEMKLLVVGIPGPETARLHSLVSELLLAERVFFVHGLSDSGLQWCYRSAEALVTPSQTEGFGLPVVEALMSGCRVVCSDISAFREIAADQCCLVPLGSGAEERLADAIVATLQNPPSAPLALPQFSSGAIGAQHVSLYRGLLAANVFRPSAHSDSDVAAPASALLNATVDPATRRGRDERC
jgi:glycosyltransferase involved in cell wall biosynthesis